MNRDSVACLSQSEKLTMEMISSGDYEEFKKLSEKQACWLFNVCNLKNLFQKDITS
jgi:hypothetical protein